MLSDDDGNLAEMTDEELDAAWDLWFDLAQATNDSDPPYTHGALAYAVVRDNTDSTREQRATQTPKGQPDPPSAD